jgi:putative ABC transport system permease protein
LDEGLSEEEARAEARRRFGDVERIGEEVEELTRRRERAMRSSDHWDDIGRNLAFAFRQLVRNRVFSVVSVLTVALAIAATTSIYSVVDGILLRPLPYPESDELVMVWADYTRRDVVLPDKRREWLSWPNFSDFRDQVGAVEAVSAFMGWGPTLTGSDTNAERLNGGIFSHGMFSDVLGVEPALGRGFLPGEDVPDGPALVLLGHGFWQRAFGGDPAILDQTILLNDQPHTVIGVMPAGFEPPAFLGTDAWTLMQFDDSNGGGRGSAFLRTVGRLRDGASLDLARAQGGQLGSRLEQEFPEANTDVGYNVYPLHFDMVQQASSALWILLGAVGLVLLIACVNVANLLLARGASRHGELAVRVALGASKGRVLAQLMTESLLLAFIGGALGFGLSFVGVEALLALAPDQTPLIEQVGVDGRIMGFAAAVTLAAGVFFGILPALRASGAKPASALKDAGRSGHGRRSGRLRSGLVVGQVALALMLLVGAGLLLRSFQKLQQVDLGFEPEGVLSMQMQLPPVRFPDATTRLAFFEQLEERLQAIPGVESVGSITNLPLAGQDGDTNFWVEGAAPPPQGLEPSVWLRRVTPDYFDAMGLELVGGRAFLPSDDLDATRVIVVNETLERDYFDGQAIGRRLNVNNPADPVWREVVGVVRDIKNFGIRAESRNAMYLPFAQAPTTFLFTTIRTSVEPASLMNPVRAAVADIDAGIAVANMRTMDELVSASLAADRFTASLLGGFALVALLLAVVGLYGVVSYSVTTRLPEMGVRIALGAGTDGIRRLILRWALSLASAGIAVGAIGALGVTRLMEGLLFDVPTTDVATFGVVSLIMALAAVTASLVPAVRATRVDPVQVLKSE